MRTGVCTFQCKKEHVGRNTDTYYMGNRDYLPFFFTIQN